MATGSTLGKMMAVRNSLWRRKLGTYEKNDTILNWVLSFSGCEEVILKKPLLLSLKASVKVNHTQ